MIAEALFKWSSLVIFILAITRGIAIGVITGRKSRRAENTMADRSSDQMRHNDLQNATQTTEDCATRTTLETGDYCRCYRRVLAVPVPLVAERTRK